MKFTFKITVYLSIIFVALSVIGGIIIWKHQQKLILKQAENKAESLFRMILITRQWVSDNRERIDPVPAVATKELSLYAKDMSAFIFHITSDKLMNPENTPDDFEKDYNVYNGAVFNLSHKVLQMMWLRPHNKFEEYDNCYLVGGGTHPGSGLPTIYQSGIIVTDLINKKYAKD